jgi:hypothetical protein
MSADNQPAAGGTTTGTAAAKAAAAGDTLAGARAAEDEATAQRRLEEDQAVADRRTAEDRELASAGHRLFLAAAAMTAAAGSGDIEQVRGANGELQEAVDAQLRLAKPATGTTS